VLKLTEKYKQEVLPQMIEKFGYQSKMAVPRIEKAVVNTGFGKEAAIKTNEEQKKIQEAILEDLSWLSGQKAVLTRAKKAIASFKIRKGMVIGAKVTLRGKKMSDFLEKVIHIVLPRSRDFRGISPISVDQRGNLTLAIREHIVFPEVSPEKVKKIFGLEITVVSTAKNREEGLELLRLLGFPIRN